MTMRQIASPTCKSCGIYLPGSFTKEEEESFKRIAETVRDRLSEEDSRERELGVKRQTRSWDEIREAFAEHQPLEEAFEKAYPIEKDFCPECKEKISKGDLVLIPFDNGLSVRKTICQLTRSFFRVMTIDKKKLESKNYLKSLSKEEMTPLRYKELRRMLRGILK